MIKEIEDDRKLIAIADLGRWNGRFSGYKEIKCLSDVMYTNCDYECIYIDGYGNLRKTESHHDGTNSILYRYWKDGVSDEQKKSLWIKSIMENVLARISHDILVRQEKK